MFAKFVVYGFLGWAIEVIFTGASSAVLDKDRAATAKAAKAAAGEVVDAVRASA